MGNNDINDIRVSLSTLENKIDNVVTDIEEIKSEIADTKKNIFDPKTGIYASIAKVENENSLHGKIIDVLGKLFWIGAGSAVTLLLKQWISGGN